MALSLGLNLNYSGRKITLDLEGINRAEKLGFDSVWTAESWGLMPYRLWHGSG